jgi:KDO2-lipid IV(A) lauroyltransferase
MRGIAKKALDYFAYANWLFLCGLLKLVPRRAVVVVSRGAGYFNYYVLRFRRAQIARNLRIAFGDALSPEQIRRLSIQCYQNATLTFYEFLQPRPFFYKMDDMFESQVSPGILQKMREDGGILLTGHVGNWELPIRYFAREGVRLTAMIKPLHNPLIDAAVSRRRRRFGTEVLSINASLKRVVDAAREKRCMIFLADQDARRQGIFVDFFGRPASTATGPALFAWKLKLPIYPCFCLRGPKPLMRMRIIACPPIMPDPKAEREAEIRRLTEEHVRVLEKVVRENPELYFWFHRRWKTRPKRRFRPDDDRTGAEAAPEKAADS